jgi:hypothetical protein
VQNATSCNSTLFRLFTGHDLSGTLVGTATAPKSVILLTSEADCLAACCANQPTCTAYSFSYLHGLLSGSGVSPCFLLSNVTAVVPVNGYSSGALISAYSA